MAYQNIDERRQKSIDLSIAGYSKSAIVRICSHEFNCSPSSIIYDLSIIGKHHVKTPKISGIYGIRYLNGLYIGSSKSIERRWSIHRSKLTSGKHHCLALQSEFSKNGGEIEFYVILECPESELITEEINQILIHKSNGYYLYNTHVPK